MDRHNDKKQIGVRLSCNEVFCKDGIVNPQSTLSDIFFNIYRAFYMFTFVFVSCCHWSVENNFNILIFEILKFSLK